MRRPIYILALACVTVGCAASCAAQQEEAMPGDADRWADADADAELAAPAAAAIEPEGSPGAGEVGRDLDQMQRELAANEAKLRALGVALPAADGSLQEDEADSATEVAPNRASEKKPSTGGAEGFAPAPPGTQPKPTAKEKQSKRENERRDVKPNKTQDKAPDMDESKAEQAKAAPLSPNTDPRQQDAAGRCSMICELSQITCELSTQICELADRHPDEDDYGSACDRAAEDCDVAQEACHVCVG